MMAGKASTQAKGEKKPAVYTRDQVLQSTKYRQYRDIAGIVLENGQQYTADEIQSKIDAFLKKPIEEKVSGRSE